MQVKFSPPFSHNLFIVTLILHDLGKPKAILDGDKALQHQYTVPVLENFLESMGFNEKEIRVSAGLISGDPIGEFLKKNQTDPKIKQTQVTQPLIQNHKDPLPFKQRVKWSRDS